MKKDEDQKIEIVYLDVSDLPQLQEEIIAEE